MTAAPSLMASSSPYCVKIDTLLSSSSSEFNPISVASSFRASRFRRCLSKNLISCRPSAKLKLNFFDSSKGRGFLQIRNGRFGIHYNSSKIFTQTLVARADANQTEDEEPVEVNEDHTNVRELLQQQKSSQLAKRVIFGIGIGVSTGGIVLAGGWVFSIALAAAVFAGSREYFELVRSHGIASGMTPPPRYVSRVCSVICGLLPLFTLYKGQIDVSVTSAAFIVAMALLLQRGNPRFSQLSSTMFGLFYCGYLPSFWVKLRCRLTAPALNSEEWELHGLYF